MDKTIESLFYIICNEYKCDLGKKASQKLFYFFEREGINLNLRYCIHYFGPYSSKLSDFMDDLELEGYISIKETQNTHKIEWVYNDTTELDSFINSPDYMIAEKVMKYFGDKTPKDLEALSTIDYISQKMDSNQKNEKDILNRVKEIKGSKFNNSDLKKYYKLLQKIELV